MTEAGETLAPRFACGARRCTRASAFPLISQRVPGNRAPGGDDQCLLTKVEPVGPAVHAGRCDTMGPVW
jgi:hypothetical protein